MRRIIFIIFFLIVFLSFSKVQAFCCKDLATDQSKCYTMGECCNGYWYPSCYRFKVWLEPKRAAFVTGQKTPINLYIKNTGVYTDNYRISYTINPSSLALVEISDSFVNSVGAGEVRLIQPMITVRAATSTGYVDFNVTSVKAGEIIETLTILESELPLSLPEFGFFDMICLIIFSGIIYFLLKQED